MLDYIFRELGVSYLGRTDLAHVVPAADEDIGGGGDGGSRHGSGHRQGGLQRAICAGHPQVSLVKGGAAPRMLAENTTHLHCRA